MEGSDWSLGSLKEYMDRRFEAMTTAIDTASTALNYRLHDMNEWRAALDVERHNYLTTDTYQSNHRLLEQRLEEVNRAATLARDNIEDKLAVRLDKLERWQAKILGAVALVLVLVPLLTALTIYYITSGHGHVTPPTSTVTTTIPSNLGH